MSLNKVMLIGRLGRDVELRYTQTGNPVASLSLATDESYTDQAGNRVQKTEWHKVIAYSRLAEICSNYLSKGSMAFVEGKIQTRKWTDQQGQDRYTTEIIAATIKFLDRKDEGVRDDAHSGNQTRNSRASNPDMDVQNDDEMPF